MDMKKLHEDLLKSMKKSQSIIEKCMMMDNEKSRSMSPVRSEPMVAKPKKMKKEKVMEYK